MKRLLPTRGRRGFSLIEAMIASFILVVGLTGITLMLLRGATNGRNGTQMMASTGYGNQLVGDFMAAKFGSLTLSPAGASFDAGNAIAGPSFFDESGREYRSAYIVSDLSTPVWKSYAIDVEVSYRDGNGTTLYNQARTIISESPDAGP